MRNLREKAKRKAVLGIRKSGSDRGADERGKLVRGERRESVIASGGRVEMWWVSEARRDFFWLRQRSR